MKTTLAVLAWYFIVFAPDGRTVSKVEFKDVTTCEYFVTYAKIKANETCDLTGGTCPIPAPLPNVVGCFWESDGPATPPAK